MDGVSDLRPLGRSVLDTSFLDHLENSLKTTADFDEVAGLDGLAKQGSLLGLLVTEPFVDTGTADNLR